MKLSTNFVKDYIDIPEEVDINRLAEDMTSVGNEYDSAEKFINATNLVVGEVIVCEMHPDSDHLHICKVNVGDEVLQIVCGAPNVRKGLKVIVALPGAVLPGDFTIKKGNIRGVESNGMICSIAELGLDSKFLKPEDKEGIHELPQEAIPGQDPIKLMQMDDGVIDFELTANRGDLLSILGMAYEIGAIYDKKVKDIDLKHSENNENINDSFKIEINTENCSMFLAKKVENVVIKESPTFIKNRLMASGIRPINNVVDISNYVMLETGQPLHYYDADTLNGMLEVRMANKGEKLTTLDEIERTLSTEDIIISDGQKAIGLAGVMGGLDTEITENTKNIIIEAAIFDSVKIRKTSKEILRSESSTRFEKGLSPDRTLMAIERSCNLLEKYADATIVGGIVRKDTIDWGAIDKKITITFEKINKVLGTTIPKMDVQDVFRRLGFTYEVTGEELVVTVPARRIDITIPEDLIEEVGRIYGVNNIKGKLPALPMKQGSYNKTIREIRNKMVNLGLNETLPYILINDKEATKYTNDEFEPIPLLDPMTEERNTLRYSLIPSLVKICEYNKAHNQKDISIFEIGKGFYKKQGEYGENTKLCVLMTGIRYEGLNEKKADFYDIKGVAEELLDYLGYAGRYSFVQNEIPKEFHPYQTALISVNNDIVGIVGKLHPEVQKDDVYVLEINLDKLLDKKVGKMKYKEISKFPNVKKDLAVIVNKDETAEEISKQIKKAAGSLLIGTKVFDVYEGESVGEDKKSIAYSLEFGTNDRTLTDDEINAILEKIITSLEKQGAYIRK